MAIATFTSLSAVKVAIAMKRVVSLKDLTHSPVLADLAALVDDRSRQRSGLLQPLSAADGPPSGVLVCFPYAGGNAVNFQPMAGALRGSGLAVYAVELPGHDMAAEREPFAPMARRGRAGRRRGHRSRAGPGAAVGPLLGRRVRRGDGQAAAGARGRRAAGVPRRTAARRRRRPARRHRRPDPAQQRRDRGGAERGQRLHRARRARCAARRARRCRLPARRRVRPPLLRRRPGRATPR